MTKKSMLLKKSDKKNESKNLKRVFSADSKREYRF